MRRDLERYGIYDRWFQVRAAQPGFVEDTVTADGEGSDLREGRRAVVPYDGIRLEDTGYPEGRRLKEEQRLYSYFAVDIATTATSFWCAFDRMINRGARITTNRSRLKVGMQYRRRSHRLEIVLFQFVNLMNGEIVRMSSVPTRYRSPICSTTSAWMPRGSSLTPDRATRV